MALLVLYACKFFFISIFHFWAILKENQAAWSTVDGALSAVLGLSVSNIGFCIGRNPRTNAALRCNFQICTTLCSYSTSGTITSSGPDLRKWEVFGSCKWKLWVCEARSSGARGMGVWTRHGGRNFENTSCSSPQLPGLEHFCCLSQRPTRCEPIVSSGSAVCTII